METKRREVVVARLYFALVWLLAPRAEAAGILDDLKEEAAQIAEKDNARAARRWMRWQVAHSAAPWIARRLREFGVTAQNGITHMHWGLWSDVRIAARRLARSRSFTVLACLTLAIGICAVSTVFSLAYALWLKPLPYLDPDRLVWIQARHEPSGTSGSLTYEEFTAHRSESRSLMGVAGFTYGANIARFDAEPVRVVADPVSPNLFRVLGVLPALGHDFADRDADRGSHVVMLSYKTWVRRFGKDAAVVGRALTMDGDRYEIAGVMPKGFVFPRGFEADVWVPATFSDPTFHNGRFLQAVARLAPGRTLEDAAAEANVRVQALAASAPPTASRWTALVVSAGATTTRAGQLTFQALLGIVGLFLIMACTNLAGQLLARNQARRTELAVRLSIGGSRWRLARMLLVESALLAAVGCSAGVLLAAYTSSAVASLMPPRMAGLDDVGLNGAVVAFAVAISLVAALLVGLAPALSLRKLKPSASLLGSRSITANMAGGQRAMVVVEVALAVVLVVGASVMLRTFLGLLDQNRGYDPRGLMALNVSLPFSDDSFLPVDVRAHVFGEMLNSVSAVPGVKRAAATTGFPGSPLGILGSSPLTPPDGHAQVIAAIHAASAGYFETMGIPIKAGRPFSASDSTNGAHVAIVNELLAREFPSGNPIGYHIPLTMQGSIAGKDALYEIVGVAGNIRLSGQIGFRVFVPLTQASPYWIDLVMRADSRAVLPAVRQALRRINPDLLLENESSFQTIISNSLALERAQSGFAVMIGGLSVVVSGGGLYTLVALMVAQRRRELGIRLALGSTPRQLFQDTMWRGLRMVAAGIALGEITSLILVKLLSSRVFGLGSADAAGYAGAAAVVLVVALAAVSIPARQVTRTDPLIALRTE